MDNQILQKILENTFTLSQLKHKVRILHEYLSGKFFTSQETPQQFEPTDIIWINTLGASFFNQFNKDNISHIFEYLGAFIKKQKPLVIYLSFEPTEETISQIGLNLRKNFTNHQIFDLKADPKLIAGAALSFNGILKDYSMRVAIENKKKEILASFKRFLQ